MPSAPAFGQGAWGWGYGVWWRGLVAAGLVQAGLEIAGPVDSGLLTQRIRTTMFGAGFSDHTPLLTTDFLTNYTYILGSASVEL